jgi:hypothetical protein
VTSVVRLLRATAVLAAIAVVTACTPPSSRQDATPAGAGRPYVVLVSLDAFRHDYLERYRPASLE